MLLRAAEGHSRSTGHEMQLRVFVPPGDHAPASLPLVVNSPAGTPLLHGSYLDQHEIYEDECLPFAEAGFVVIQYSLDGNIPDGVDPSEQQNYQPFLETAYQEFYSAGAGVVNGRNTIDYALARLPYVDPKRIVCSGHSSAGNVSLLLAAYDHRVSRCIAFAAAYDTETRLGELRGEPWARRSFPSLGSFIADTSPMNKVGKYHCPLFVFHAKDDSNVPFQDAERFDFSLKSAGKSVKFVTSDTANITIP